MSTSAGTPLVRFSLAFGQVMLSEKVLIHKVKNRQRGNMRHVFNGLLTCEAILF